MGLLILSTIAYLPLLAVVFANVIVPAYRLARRARADLQGTEDKARAQRMIRIGALEITGLTLAHGMTVGLYFGSS